jgi:hypothetical protein
MGRTIWVLIFTALVPAQTPRVLRHFDGRPVEAISVDGRSTYVHVEDRFVEGTGALRIAPSDSDEYYGVTLWNLDGRSPKALRWSILQEGSEPVTYLIKLEDAGSGRDKDQAGYLEKECAPGHWIEVEIDLTAVPNRRGNRNLDFQSGVRFFRFSRKQAGPDDPAFLIDNLRFIGEADTSGTLKSAQAAIGGQREGDGDMRARTLRESLPYVPEPDRLRLSLAGLERDAHERVRRACREALASLGTDESVDGLLAVVMKAKGDLRLELLWALASMPSLKARAEALRLAAEPTTPWLERTALLQGLALGGAEDLGSAAAASPPIGPWPQRAALVHALLEAASHSSVDLLISVLEKPGSMRVERDTANALVRLTGKDFGTQAAAWRDWWAKNRSRTFIENRAPGRGLEYGAFFGVPVGPGRHAFILDVSGSMRDPVKGGRAQKHIASARHLQGARIENRLDLAKAELKHALENLPAGTFAGIIVFNDEAQWLTRGIERAEAAMKDRALERLQAVGPGQKTNIHDALAAAFHPGRKPGPRDWEEGPDTIFLLTDGEPSVGPIKEWQELRDAILRWNLGRMIRIHVISLGDEGDPSTTGFSAWCRATGGVFQDLSSERKKEGRRP